MSDAPIETLPLHDGIVTSVKFDGKTSAVSIYVRTVAPIHRTPGQFVIRFDRVQQLVIEHIRGDLHSQSTILKMPETNIHLKCNLVTHPCGCGDVRLYRSVAGIVDESWGVTAVTLPHNKEVQRSRNSWVDSLRSVC
jgi:hypothetical protein